MSNLNQFLSDDTLIGETIIAPTDFLNSNYVKLNNHDKTLLDNTTYANLVPYLKPNLLNGTDFEYSTNPNPIADDNFGNSVSISGDGTRAIAGVWLKDVSGQSSAGAALVFSRSGTTWTLEQTIDNPTPAGSDNFGASVSIDSTGTRVIIGAYQEDTGAFGAGSAYVYSRSGTTWTLEQEINNPTPVINDFFAAHVSIDDNGDRVLISNMYDDIGADDTGSAYIYSRSGITWTLEQEILNPDPVLNDYFSRVGLDINGSGNRVIIGAYSKDNGADGAGSVYVYSRSDTTWSLEQEINNPSPVSGDNFGYAISVNSDGDRVIIGAYNNDTGASNAGSAYVYSRSGTTWSLEQTINNPSPGSGDYFGNSVSISGDGSRIIIGAYGESTGFSDSGAVYSYSRTDTTWRLEEEILNPTGAISDYFSRDAVSITNDGSRVIIGNENEDYLSINNSGAIWIFNFTDANNMVVSAQGLPAGSHKYMRYK